MMDIILQYISKLCHSADYAIIASIYLTTRLIIAYTSDGDYDSTIRTSDLLRRAFYNYSQVISPALTDENITVWCSLCAEMHRTGLDQDYRAFFAFTAPSAVFDWASFSNFFPEGDVGRLLVALCLILRDAPPESLIVSSEWLQQHYTASEDLYRKIGLSFDAYKCSWRAVHYTDLASSEHRPSGSIIHAIRLYHSMQLPMTDLLRDYSALYLEQGELARRIAVRGARKASRTTLTAEGSTSEHDMEFERRLEALSHETPSDVIRGLFYPPIRNDSGFECTYLMATLYATADSADHVLIVNPSPDMICHIMRYRMICSSLVFVVADETIARLYARQFSCDAFATLEQIIRKSYQFNRILLTSRDQPLEPMLECLRLISSGARVTALIPEVSLKMAYEKLDASEMHIRYVISIPTNATQSSPRRKVLVEADSQWPADYFLLLKGLCDDTQTLFGVSRQWSKIPHTWLCSHMSIVDMRKAANKRPVSKHVTDPMIVRYSPEICFRLTIQYDCKGRVAGRIHYRKILRPEDKHRKRGDRITPVIEKGLRKHTVSEVIAAVEYVALDERIAPAVVDDILDYYAGRLHELSLKTVWYCLRSILLTKYSYRDSLALELFIVNGELSMLVIGTSLPKAYDEALSSTFPQEEIPKQYWNQLNLILTAAQDMGMISSNPLYGYMSIVSARLSKRQQDIRNALVKKSYEIEEEQLMLHNYLDLSWFETDPLAVIVLIAMMAVPDLREAVALRWVDLAPNVILGTYHLHLTRYLAADGVMRPLYDRAAERYRCVPLAPILSKILLAYKAYLMETYGLCEDELALCPIVLEQHTILRKGSTKAKHCRLHVASARVKEFIGTLKIPSNEIILPDAEDVKTTDLSTYHGNFLYTNLRHHLRHICMFTEGELCYFLGNKAPDTFSAHYCAYDHPLLQHRMALKLNRWTVKFSDAASWESTVSHQEHDVVEDEKYVFRGNHTGLAHADLVLIPQNAPESGDIVVKIESDHGTTGSVIAIMNEEESVNGEHQ